MVSNESLNIWTGHFPSTIHGPLEMFPKTPILLGCQSHLGELRGEASIWEGEDDSLSIDVMMCACMYIY